MHALLKTKQNIGFFSCSSISDLFTRTDAHEASIKLKNRSTVQSSYHQKFRARIIKNKIPDL
jgi:hypothetical protein